jgi:hypothetical protein
MAFCQLHEAIKMIEIKITDPHLMDKKTIEKTALYLMGLIGSELIPAPIENNPNGFTPEELEPVSIESENIKEPSQSNFNPFAKTPTAPISPVISPPINEPVEKELDSRGFPWDNRIHAATKTKNSDGTWRYMRGAQKSRIEKVEDELIESGNCLSSELVREESETIAPLPPSIPKPPSLPLYPTINQPINEEVTFQSIMQKITNGIMEGKLIREDVLIIAKNLGVESLTLLGSNLHVLPELNKQIEAKLNAN